MFWKTVAGAVLVLLVVGLCTAICFGLTWVLVGAAFASWSMSLLVATGGLVLVGSIWMFENWKRGSDE